MMYVFNNRLCSYRYSRIYFIFILFLILVAYLFTTKDYSGRNVIKCLPTIIVERVLPNMPVVKIYGIKEKETKLDIVKKSFSKIGYKIDMNNDSSSWEVLWSYTYPFYSLREEFLNLKHYQKINHFPGSGYITQKNNLALLSIDYIPKSFLLPTYKKEFIQYAEDNKNAFWVMKNSNHRGIRILNGTENLDTNGTFVQEFIKNPLLINGKKFDIGVYVMLASIDPLRVYIYSDDILLRFCQENYFPLNINFVESYVVGEDYLPVWEVPDLKFFYSELKYTAKESLNAYLHFKGKSTRRLWSQISQIIRDVYLTTEESFKRSAMALGSLRNFFELVRFDFITDESLNVYLLEVNMSPNLSAAHFPQNSLLYEQVVFNSLQLIGLVRKFHDSFFYKGNIEVSERDIQVNSEQCSSPICHRSCQNFKCKVCNQCLSTELKDIFKSAYLEHTNRGKYRRVVPVPAVKGEDFSFKLKKDLSPMNEIMDNWFKGKCLQDVTWCQ